MSEPKKRGRPSKADIEARKKLVSTAARSLRDPESDEAERALAASVLARSDDAEIYATEEKSATLLADAVQACDRNVRRDNDPSTGNEERSCDTTSVGAARKIRSSSVSGVNGLELDALKREAWEAFDYQIGRGKTDTLGRIWGFEPDIRNGHTTVVFTLKRPGTLSEKVEHVISTAQYGIDGARQMSDDLVEQMNGELV